jgi:sugar/nucleoside kinase (ribokinase family)
VFYVSLGSQGALAIRSDEVTAMPAFEVDVIDTTGAGDAFTAGCIWGLLEHANDREVLRRGNLLGGLACTALGARAGLPSRDQALAALKTLRTRASDA